MGISVRPSVTRSSGRGGLAAGGRPAAQETDSGEWVVVVDGVEGAEYGVLLPGSKLVFDGSLACQNQRRERPPAGRRRGLSVSLVARKAMTGPVRSLRLGANMHQFGELWSARVIERTHLRRPGCPPPRKCASNPTRCRMEW